MKATMNHPIDDVIGFISGITGAGIYAVIAGITWETLFASLGQLLWLGFVALFTGAMGVLGKHLITKYVLKKKKNNQT